MGRLSAASALAAWRRAVRRLVRATRAREIAERIDGWRLERARRRQREAEAREAEARDLYHEAQQEAYDRAHAPREDDPRT